MKNLLSAILIAFTSIVGYNGHCAVSIDSIPAYYSADGEYFSFTTSTHKYLFNSKHEKIFIYKIFKGISLVDQYWINKNCIIKLKIRDSEFLDNLITGDTVHIDGILSQYKLTEKAHVKSFSIFFQIEFKNVKQKKGRVYGCGQDQEGHETTFTAFRVNIKHNSKKVFSKDFKFSQPAISEFEDDINNMIVFCTADEKAFIAYGAFFYQEDSFLYWSDDEIIFYNKNN